MKLAFHVVQNSVFLAGIKLLKSLIAIIFFYLMQVVVMPHLKVFGIMPNLLMVIIAIMTVSYGKLYAFITGAVIGILLEAMGVSTPLFYLLIFPVLALLWAQLFADMSDIKREMRRIRAAQRSSEKTEFVLPYTIKRKFNLRFRRTSPYDLNAHLRIFLNALALTASYEIIMMIYIVLSGIPVTFVHITRTLNTLLYTAVCCIIMFPVRAFLGLYRRKRRISQEAKNREIRTERKLLEEMAMAPDEELVQKKRIFPFFNKGASIQTIVKVNTIKENEEIPR